MIYFQLMTSELPPEVMDGRPPYVTPDEALKAASEEARNRGQAIQIYMLDDAEVKSQPWRVVHPSGDVTEDL